MADGIMDRIETINNIPLCDREARTLLDGKAPKEHTHDNYATITEIKNVYLTPMSDTLKALETQYTNLLAKFNNIEAKFSNIETKFNSIESRFNNIETRLDDIEARLDDIESGTIVKPTVMYTIVYGLTEGISISNTTTSINAGSRYVTTITYEEGYTYGSIRIEMGGVDITNSVTIHAPGPNQQGFAIEEVTGNLNINIVAKKTEIAIYKITYSLGTGITLNHQLSETNHGASMEWTITCSDGYKLDSGACYITMGGVDVSSNVFHYDGNNNITSIGIENITGNININLASKSTEIPCTSISLYTEAIKMYEINGTATNTASVLPANTTDTIRWESSNPAVATVQRNRGVITAVGEGRCEITAYCGNQKASCTVVVEIEANIYNIIYYLTGVASSNNQKTIEEGASYYSKITLTNSNYTITSAKLTINGATKNQYLTVTDHVIVNIPDGTVNGDIVITVNTQEKTYPCTSLQCAGEMWLAMGDTQPIELWINPTNTTDELTWSVDAYNALYIYKSGSTVYIRAQNMTGTYIVTFTCGSCTDTCIVTVGSNDIECTNIQFNVPSISVSANKGSWDCAQYLMLTPSNTTDPVEWYTDTTDYFYITQNGVISFSKVGTYRVQARCNGLSATLTVIIN